MARIAKALDTLRSQVNTLYPKRSKLSDGWIGDSAHAARKSDHNPNGADVVQALDITHDPARGVDTWAMAEVLRINRDPRIKYVISNGRIFSSARAVELKQAQGPAWVWRPYSGNKHDKHIHVSVLDGAENYDNPDSWLLANNTPVAPTPRPPAPLITTALRKRMMERIVAYEARRDANKQLAIYQPSDGSNEIAGINDRYHPAEYKKIADLLAVKNYPAAEAAVQDYILRYTNVVLTWGVTDAGVEFYLRDCCFNRGPSGTANILQRALGVGVDEQIGPTTRAALTAVADIDGFLGKLRAAREAYELAKYGRRAGLWNGLVNRWNNSLVDARKFRLETLPVQSPGVRTTTEIGVAAGGGLIAGKAKESHGWLGVAVVVVAALVVGIILWKLWPRKNKGVEQ